jgi:hypothetical protein
MAKAEQTVVALVSGYYGVDGKSVAVIEGETFHADDPVVKKYPSRFAKDKGAPVVEQATAAPGEQRSGKVS